MIANLLVIGLVIGPAALWASRAKGYGIFSAFLAMVCTIAAGGIAFAVWEPLTYAYLMDFREDLAWTIGLLVPFAIALVLLRLLVDTTVKANLDFGEIENFIGGGLFGIASGIVSVGILVIGLSHLPVGPSLMGFKPVEDQRGNLVYEHGLWLPVDKITTKLYEHLSLNAFSPGDSALALHRPDIYEQAALNRMTYDGTARATIKPEEFRIYGKYAIDAPLNDLLTDTFQPGKTQNVQRPDGEAPESGSRLVGYIVTFESGAKERRTGQFILGSGQARLVCRDDEDAIGVHPIAVVAQPEATSVGMYRFRFESEDTFIPSVGGTAKTTFALEFLVPPGYEPEDLIIKNARVDIPTNLTTLTYRSVEDRDQGIRSLAMFQETGAPVGGMATDIDVSTARRMSAGGTGQFPGVDNANRLPKGLTINKTVGTGGLSVDEENRITGGQGSFTLESMRARGLDRNLRVETFATSRDTGLIQLTLSDEGQRSQIGQVVERLNPSGAPILIDERNAAYECIGYFYSDGETVEIRYTPGDPIASLDDMPALSQSKRNQTLILLFRPTKGLDIQYFAIGSQALVEFAGGLEVR